jgi:DNA-directed RNA polymerase specialized sigma24 family protein
MIAAGQEEFERFLAWLDPDPDRAAIEYTRLHRKLRIFFNGRDCGPAAEELADRSLNRAIQKMRADPEVAGSPPAMYIFGIARNILREFRKQPKLLLVPDDLPDGRSEPHRIERLQCLAACLAKLTEEQRNIIVDYHANDKGARIATRVEVAGDLQKSRGALRIQAFRIKRVLLDCMAECLGQPSGGVTFKEGRAKSK